MRRSPMTAAASTSVFRHDRRQHARSRPTAAARSNFSSGQHRRQRAVHHQCGRHIRYVGPDGRRMTAGWIEGRAIIFSAPKALTVGGNNLSTAVSGVISGSGSLIKAGTGTLTLTGTNTYTGVTEVTGGASAFLGGGSIANWRVSVSRMALSTFRRPTRVRASMDCSARPPASSRSAARH